MSQYPQVATPPTEALCCHCMSLLNGARTLACMDGVSVIFGEIMFYVWFIQKERAINKGDSLKVTGLMLIVFMVLFGLAELIGTIVLWCCGIEKRNRCACIVWMVISIIVRLILLFLATVAVIGFGDRKDNPREGIDYVLFASYVVITAFKIYEYLLIVRFTQEMDNIVDVSDRQLPIAMYGGSVMTPQSQPVPTRLLMIPASNELGYASTSDGEYIG